MWRQIMIGGDHVNNLAEEDHSEHSSVPEVQQALQKINPKKSSGWDSRISPKLLKSVAEGTAASLTKLYNNCIEQGEWHNAWKMGECTPAYKKGDRQDTTSYRPITSLTAVDKIFEQLLCNQVTCHYDKTLYNRMTAYRKKHSCETTLLALIEDWKLAADTKQLVYILSTDMRKAFDSLSHSLTIKKLEAYGFGRRSLELMRSFFENRHNRVKLGEITSDWIKMKRGCPQGSSFGLLLMYVKGTDHETVGRSLKIYGSQALAWYSKNYLKANPDKFQSLNINPRKIDKDKSDTALSIDDIDITKTEQIKLLGVHIDDNLEFTEHIRVLCIKASQKVRVLSRLRNLIPCKATLLLYKTFILPYLTYCHLTWQFQCKSSDKRKLERIQERALRVIFRSHAEAYNELLGRADLPTLYNRRLQDTATLMYKVKNGLAPDNVSALFVRKDTTHSLRNSDFVLPRFDTKRYGKHCIRYLGPLLCSKLRKDLKNSPTVAAFKTKIRKLNLSDYVDNNSNCCKLCSK
ncbi:hypothetical protein ACROYT_G043830 [Oculina patagonica]